MAEISSEKHAMRHDGVAKVATAGPKALGSVMSSEVSQVSEILRARSFAKLRNQSNGDLEE